MGIYVDADDIRQHMRGGNALTIETIEELMEEQEYYVQTVLNLTELPTGNPILANIIRDLTIASAIYSLTAPNADDLTKADSMRREALRRLQEADRGSLGVSGGTPPGNPEDEVYWQYEGSMFTLSDFDQFNQLGSQYTIYTLRTEQDGYR